MRFILLFLLAAVLCLRARRAALFRHCGYSAAAQRIYRRWAWALGGITLLAMLVQEAVLLLSGQLDPGNGLPLHLCSMMGVLTLPMLLSGSRILWQISLFLGMPGALMALLFPAVLSTPWPRITAASFHLMHLCVAASPLLPLGMGRRPTPAGAAWALGFLALLAGAAHAANSLTGGNYLFLRYVPLEGLSVTGMAGIALAVLGAEAAVCWAFQRRRKKKAC